ncbi:MAG: hypothetical protein M1820_000544 [Bogoriella megaspora]|nr:MAG: hypothetical protein M1820_000544 [Bogoriella megaspora]
MGWFSFIRPKATVSSPAQYAKIDVPASDDRVAETKDGKGQPSSFSPKYGSSYLDNLFAWGFEILAALVMVASFVILVIILLKFNGTPQSSWPVHLLSLNALVALLATIIHATIVFTLAQGIGQGKYAWFFRGKEQKAKSGKELRDLQSFDDASRGALGSLLLLGRVRQWNLTTIGAASTVLALAVPTFTQQVLTTEYRMVKSLSHGSVPGIARAQNYNGTMLSPNGAFDPSDPSYAWIADLPALSSIYTGVFGGPVEQLKPTCPTGDCSWPTTPTLGVCHTCAGTTHKLRLDTYVADARILDVDDGWDSKLTGISPSGSTGESQPGLVITGLTVTGIQNPVYGGNCSNNATSVDCYFWYCLQAYNVSVQAGRYEEKLVGTWNKVSNNNDLYDPPVFIDIPPEINADELGDGRNYSVDMMTLNSIPDEFSDFFFGHATADYAFSSDVMRIIYASLYDIPAFAQKLALSMTNNVRLKGQAPATDRYNGTVSASVAFIKVSWPWIAYTAVVAALSLIFLGMSIFHTRISREPPA